ncbi:MULTISPECIES: DUF2933 domain-containing protein [unclassified Frankia]|uniref:DUF2933 domain-containing protein n=1 Tax=unclassified Frankia TaxID=2632575 RepID=UPI002AD55EF2|nr:MULTISPECIES: DUF2933 domain-containing protein [unclassified Frankia]
MMKKNVPVYALAASIIIGGLVITGLLPATALFTLLLLAGCPLMMFFMMGGMGGDDHHHEKESNSARPQR